jgi:hypothetical protein
LAQARARKRDDDENKKTVNDVPGKVSLNGSKRIKGMIPRTQAENKSPGAIGVDADADLDAFVKLVGEREVFLTTLPPTGEQIARNGSIKRTVRAMDSRGKKGVYWCINPLRADTTRANSNVERRAHLYIDVDDPDHDRRLTIIDDQKEIETQVPATDAGKEQARGVRDEIVTFLSARKWPSPILIDSGNGYATLYRIDLPNDQATDIVIGAFLDELARKFGALVDTSVKDAARLARVPGTINRRGHETPTRPFRLCHFLDVPQYTGLVTTEMIRSATDNMTREREQRECEKKNDRFSFPGADDRAKAVEALRHLSQNRTVNYTDWVNVGMALHNIADDLLEEWDTWSRGCPEKYEQGACAKKWKSFTRGGGLGIGSLLFWAKQDSPKSASYSAGHAPAGAPSQDTAGAAKSIVAVILDYLRAKYGPTFRRGANIWAESLGREVSRAEACAAPTSDIIPALLAAANFPRDTEGRPKLNAVPSTYRQWAPMAWADLLGSLPDEADSPEITETAAEQFRAVVANAMMHIEALAHRHQTGKEERVEVQRRSLIEWCRLFAKHGPWQSIRSLELWCRLDNQGHLQVAMHQRLFGQIHRGHGAPSTHRRFVDLCQLYGVGVAGRTSRSRFVELSSEFIADLNGSPCDGRCDNDCDAALTHECESSTSQSSSQLPSSGAAVHDIIN